MSQSNTPTRISLQECDPQKNILMKKNGIRGVIVAIVVVASAVLLILISKWNEVRQERIPFVWRNRLKSMIQDCVSTLKMAQESTVAGTSYKYALEANVLLNSAKKLVGTADLGKLSSLDVSKLESEIESLLRRNIPNSLLITTDSENMKKQNKNIDFGHKQLQPEKYNQKTILRDAQEAYKLQYDDSRK